MASSIPNLSPAPPAPPPSSSSNPPGRGGGMQQQQQQQSHHHHHPQSYQPAGVDAYGRPIALQPGYAPSHMPSPYGGMPVPSTYPAAQPTQQYRPTSLPPPPPPPPPPSNPYTNVHAQSGYAIPAHPASPYGGGLAPSMQWPYPYGPPYQPTMPPYQPSPQYGAFPPGPGYGPYPYDHALAMAYSEGFEGRPHRRHHSSHDVRSSKDASGSSADAATEDDQRKWHQSVIEAATNFVQSLPPQTTKQILTTAVTAAFQGAAHSRRPTRKGKAAMATTATATATSAAPKAKKPQDPKTSPAS